MSDQKIDLLPPKADKNATITCYGLCGRDRKTRYFYKDMTGNSAIGYIPFCKDCCRDMCIDKNGEFSQELFLDLLKNPMVNKPFISHLFEKAIMEKDPVGAYFKALAISPKLKTMSWKDTERSIKSISGGKVEPNTVLDNNKYVVEKGQEEVNTIVVSADSVRKWGVGFEPEEYVMLDEMYEKLSRDFEIDTGVQEEYLQNACICQMRNKVALADGQVVEAEKWGKQFDSYMASGKLKPNQISNADRMGGITNFSTFFQYIEKSNNFIPDFPDIMLDDIDFAIYTILNYVRTLMGVPPITLGKVKEFTTYDYERGQEIIFPDKSEVDKSKADIFDDIDDYDDYEDGDDYDEA